MLRNYSTRVFLVIAIAIGLSSCTALREIESTLTNISRCKFKLDSVADFTLAGIPLNNKASLSDISIADGVVLAGNFAKGKLPASFVLNVAAVNPNDGTGGSKRASATLTSFAWTLILDNKTTITGNIAKPVTIPGTGQQVLIPLRMELDLLEFFKNDSYETLVNLALALGGIKGSPAKITLRARPTISTKFGPITYPGEINIIDREFRAQ
ncbi:MAG: hypothetical protein GXO82_11235 [Chlorobi bacterium]|nr:hypothetical protein [Chlorobiota bacterium]